MSNSCAHWLLPTWPRGGGQQRQRPRGRGHPPREGGRRPGLCGRAAATLPSPSARASPQTCWAGRARSGQVGGGGSRHPGPRPAPGTQVSGRPCWAPSGPGQEHRGPGVTPTSVPPAVAVQAPSEGRCHPVACEAPVMARSLTRGCCPWCLTDEEKTAARIDQEINKILLEQKKQERGELKLLLLGPGESGKSTFIKQMRIIHGAGYSEDDRRAFRPLVYQNIFVSMQAMIDAMDRLQIPYSRPDSKHASLVMTQDPYKVTAFGKPYAMAMQYLWRDAGIRACYERRREFHLLDSAVYYLSHLERIAEDSYIPTAQDVLRSRMPTTGINEYCFSVQKTKLRIVDVGGQKSERKKWIHCFENVIALIYLASLSEYDQCLEENDRENRMKESLALFSTILELPWFKSTSVILFLNKTDILEEKIHTSHLATYFPSFQGPLRDAEAAKHFIMDMYARVYAGCAEPHDGGRKGSRARRLFAHFTCATDTHSVRSVFKDVRDSVLARYLDEINLL